MTDEWGDTADEWGGIDDEVNPSDPSEPSEPEETSVPSEPSGPSDPSAPSDVKLASPIKTEWDEYPTYLYPELYDDVQEAYLDLEYQCKKEADWAPEKYRHFQTVAWSIALEELSEMDAEEFVDRVDELGLRD